MMSPKLHRSSDTASALPVGRLWDAALPRIRSKIGEDNFNAWIAPLEVSGGGDTVKLAAPTAVISASVNRHFVQLISRILKDIRGRPCTVHVSAARFAEHADDSSAIRTWTSREATFDRFVVGESNRDAYCHAAAVASGQFRGPSPLVLFGWVGLGKTHLAGAIANEMRAKHPSRPVICQPSTDFVDQLLVAMQGDRPQFSWDEVTEAAALILDDVHFLVGHAATQEALVQLFSLLHERGTPVVLTSDRPPQEISDVEQRLRRRFESGVLACIKPPEFDLRRRILLQKATDRGIDLPDDVAAFMAERVVGSGRTLEGVLTRLHAFAAEQSSPDAAATPLTCRLAAKALRAFDPPRASITPELIRAVVSEVRGLPLRALTGGRRTREVTLARQLAMYLCRKHCKLPLREIAQRFGRRDHSTVLHACAVVEEKLASDSALQTLMSKIEELVQTRAR